MVNFKIDAQTVARELNLSLENIRKSVVDAMREEGQRFENHAAASWPVGPAPGGLRPGHSQTLFGEVDVIETDDGIRFNIDNQAPYAEWIHQKGLPGRLVWQRDILEPITNDLTSITKSITDSIMRAF